MHYLYHRVPKDMTGNTLYPLNRLKDIYPEIYTEQIKKYKGREQVLQIEIPQLNCLWNDVLHFTAVSPQDLKDALGQAGILYDPMSYFKVPVSLVEGENSIAFMYKENPSTNSNIKQYEIFDVNKMDIYGKIPKETIEYYKEKKAEGEKPLLFNLVPHILYKGTIDTQGLEIVTA